MASTLLERAFTPCPAHADDWDKLKTLDGSYATNLRWHYAADHSGQCADCNEGTLAAAEAYATSRANRREPGVRRHWWYEQDGYCLAGEHNKHGRRVYHDNNGKRADCPDCWNVALQRWSAATRQEIRP